MGESLKDLPEAPWRPILWGGDEIWRLKPGHGLTDTAEQGKPG